MVKKLPCVITRSRVWRDRSLLIKSRYLRRRCSVECFNLDHLQEVRPFGAGSFTISSYTSNYILYWCNNYFGMSVFVTPWMDLSMSHLMDLWLMDFCDYNPVLIIIMFLSPSVRWSTTHSCGFVVIPTTPSTSFIIIDSSLCCPILLYLSLFGAWLPWWGLYIYWK